MRYLITCIVAVALAAPAAACLNDSELPTHEREFRSQYGKPTPPPEPPPDTSAEPAPSTSNGILAGGAGILLLVGATVFAVRGFPTRG